MRATQLRLVCLRHSAITEGFLCSSSFSDALRLHCLGSTCLWYWSFGYGFAHKLTHWCRSHHPSFFFQTLRLCWTYFWSLPFGDDFALKLAAQCWLHCLFSDPLSSSSLSPTQALCWSSGCVFPITFAAQHRLCCSSSFLAALRFHSTSAAWLCCFTLCCQLVLTLAAQCRPHRTLFLCAPVGFYCPCWTRGWCSAFGRAFTLGFAGHSHLFG